MSAGQQLRALVPRCVSGQFMRTCCMPKSLMLTTRRQLLELSEGDEAGIKSAMWEFTGRYAYGYLLSEKGTHRLVRLSPFNAKAARQTSFAGVELMPVLTEAVNAEVPEEDLEISFTRSGGKGGQNVNKVETAVRIKHIPTGVFVKCTQERHGPMRILAARGLSGRLCVIGRKRATRIGR